MREKEWKDEVTRKGANKDKRKRPDNLITQSPRFHEWLPLLQGVPGFDGIRIHAGNYPDDTQGCILPGENRLKGMVVSASGCTASRAPSRQQGTEGNLSESPLSEPFFPAA